ncbi:MAG: ABC transporter permease [Proteobacteria bacterium]|nr:ABC transporter permease [Pseudomonadota bacterium]
MTGFLLRRLASLCAALLVASLVVFIVLQILPGDPALVILGPDAQPDTLAALRHQLGLDLPVWLRYLRWAADLLTGDFGRSTAYDTSVASLILQRIGVTLPLAGMAMLLATALGIPLGVWAAHRRGAVDGGIMGVTQIGVAVPDFWLALLLILVFGVHFAWFPTGGFPGWWHGAGASLRALILPTIALAIPQAAILARVTRGAVLDVGVREFLRTARAKGLGEGTILWRHTVPNALIPVITLMGLQFSFLLAGTIIMENVFALPGLGSLLFQAIGQRDLVLVQDLVLLFAAFVIVINFAVDLLNAAIDPRLRGRQA